jgi:hypothetical protein
MGRSYGEALVLAKAGQDEARFKRNQPWANNCIRIKSYFTPPPP